MRASLESAIALLLCWLCNLVTEDTDLLLPFGTLFTRRERASMAKIARRLLFTIDRYHDGSTFEAHNICL